MKFEKERRAFEQWAIKDFMTRTLSRQNDGSYLSLTTDVAWNAWQARVNLCTEEQK
ncbi:hypothetical protein JHL22_05190 [Advenella sp. WQ 585]|uniref:Uncharacterized protein n=1 Tax=Advenella mandrilli TaxID=2800330 RepID=A0ABS1EAQ6_9BURK|nr:hypothetical protein [Advenella mandrilli]MBK1780606.1 hypothetical protein [Advenella mandrilli]